jgi:hypothetical protein
MARRKSPPPFAPPNDLDRWKEHVAHITEIMERAQEHIDAAERLKANAMPKTKPKRKRR